MTMEVEHDEHERLMPTLIRDFIATYDRTDPTDRWIRTRLLERLHGELYRREREHYSEYVDLGGEA